MSSAPRVSVVIPCHNQGRYLSDAIDSVLDQTYANIEIIVVDDGSPDATQAIIRGYGDKVRSVLQAHRGVCAARNSGVRASTGTYLQYLDADDRLEREKIRRQVEFLERHPHIGIVYSDVRYFTTENPLERSHGPWADPLGRPWVGELWRAPGSMLIKLAHRNILPINCPLVRKQVANLVGRWNETLHAGEDWEYWIRCAATGVKFHFEDLPGTLALVRLHDSSASTNRSKMEAGSFDMRLSVARSVNDKEFSATNFKNALRWIEYSREDRVVRLWRLARAKRTLNGAVTAILIWLFAENGPGYPMRRLMGRLMPRPVQKAFLRLMGMTG